MTYTTQNPTTGSTLNARMPAKVVSKADIEEKLRIQVRFMDQSEKEIPDKKLPWTIALGQSSGGILGHSTVGRYFIGQWVDAERMGDLGSTVMVHGIISSPDKDQA